jgi:hypothetical protein
LGNYPSNSNQRFSFTCNYETNCINDNNSKPVNYFDEKLLDVDVNDQFIAHYKQQVILATQKGP